MYVNEQEPKILVVSTEKGVQDDEPTGTPAAAPGL